MNALRTYERQELMERDLEDTRDLLMALDEKLDRLLDMRIKGSEGDASNKERTEADELQDKVPLYVITPT